VLLGRFTRRMMAEEAVAAEQELEDLMRGELNGEGRDGRWRRYLHYDDGGF
jgi:hypothetical protein